MGRPARVAVSTPAALPGSTPTRTPACCAASLSTRNLKQVFYLLAPTAVPPSR